MNKVLVADKLIEQGVQAKKNGYYEKAKDLYLQALNYNPEDYAIYLNLGKVCYLLGEYGLAERSYLAFMHLQLNIREMKEKGLIEYDVIEKNRNRGIYNDLPQHIKDILPTVSALVILQDPNTPRHFAHAMIDGVNKNVRKYKDVYMATLAGASLELALKRNKLTEDEYYNFENNQYIGFGREQLLDLIRWDKLLSKDVLSLYFK